MQDMINYLPTNNLKIALAQMLAKDGDIQGNVNQAVKMIKIAAKNNVKIIIFPEKFLTGYVPNLIESDKEKYTISDNDKRLKPLYEVCKKYTITAIIGAPTNHNGKLYISSIVIGSDGKEKVRYHKMNLFESEKNIYTKGTQMVILKLHNWKLGLGICYDSGFPEHARILAQAGCHAYVVSALFSKSNGYKEAKIWFPARALDNTIYTTMTNYCGETGTWETCGVSGIWNPMGQLVNQASHNNPALIYAELNSKNIQQARINEKMLMDSRYYKIKNQKILTIKL